MSEYQYYEFRAIDRPLTKEEMAELRSLSSRATISPTGFVNEYHWGDLKGDPAQWMRQYFDAYVYSANWCSCTLALRLPRDVFAKSDLQPYMAEDALSIDAAKTHWIINWSLGENENHERFAMEEGPGWIDRLIPLRDELLRGDLRPLYLGWLAAVSSGDIDDDALEPTVPLGLSRLSAAQKALVEFLEIDADVLAAAAAGSPDADEVDDDDSAETWLAGLPGSEMKLVLSMLLRGASAQAERRVKAAFFAWQKESGSIASSHTTQRSAAELRAVAYAGEELRVAQQAQERARDAAAVHAQREARLRSMAGNVAQCWHALAQTAQRGTSSAYDEAARAMAELAEAYALTSSRQEFDRALAAFILPYAKRKALLRRLVLAGLLQDR